MDLATGTNAAVITRKTHVGRVILAHPWMRTGLPLYFDQSNVLTASRNSFSRKTPPARKSRGSTISMNRLYGERLSAAAAARGVGIFEGKAFALKPVDIIQFDPGKIRGA